MKGIVFTVRKNKNISKIPRDFNLKYHLKKYGVLIIFIISLLFGFIIGAVFSSYKSFTNTLYSFFGADVFTSSASTAVEVFAAQLTASFMLILLIFLLGVCAAGAPFLPFAAAVKGLGMGAIVSSLTYRFALKGIVFYLLNCFIGDILFIIALLSECKFALPLSVKLAKMLFFNKSSGTYAGDDIKEFSIHTSYMLALAALAAAINTLLHMVFAGI